MFEPIEPASKLVALKIVSAIFAIAASSISYLGLQEVAFFGFPDGHITDYQRVAAPALNFHYYLLAGLGIFFFIVTITGGIQKKFVRIFVTASIIFVLILLVAKVGIPLYFGSYLALDNGVGG